MRQHWIKNIPKSIMTNKALVTTVSIGNLEIEGLMLPDGSFAIAISQIADLIQRISNSFRPHKNYFSQDVKRLLGNSFRPHKTTTELNNSKVNVLSITDFRKVMIKLSHKDKGIESFVDDLLDLSLTQLFNDAFGVKFEQEERQAWLKHRQTHRKHFHPKLTKWLKKDGCFESWEYGKAVNKFKSVVGLPLITIDQYNTDQIDELNRAEHTYDVLRSKGFSHIESIDILS